MRALRTTRTGICDIIGANPQEGEGGGEEGGGGNGSGKGEKIERQAEIEAEKNGAFAPLRCPISLVSTFCLREEKNPLSPSLHCPPP